MTEGEDDWLERWLPLVVGDSKEAPILELGCGYGRDTRALLDAGVQVIAMDRSSASLDEARRRNPEAMFYLGDIRDGFPRLNAPYPVVLASLCLHYFSWPETLALIGSIHTALEDGGLLLCRVNSTDDVNYGATGYPQIEPNFYQVGPKTKRFFDAPAVEMLFSPDDWSVLSMEKRSNHRFGALKIVWEVVVRKQHSRPHESINV